MVVDACFKTVTMQKIHVIFRPMAQLTGYRLMAQQLRPPMKKPTVLPRWVLGFLDLKLG